MDLITSLWLLLVVMLGVVVTLAVLSVALTLWMLLVGGSTSLLSRCAAAVITQNLGRDVIAVDPSDRDRLWRLGAPGTAGASFDRSDLVHVAELVERLAAGPAPRSSPRLLEVSSTLRHRQQLLEEAAGRLQRRCSLVTGTTAIRRARLYVVQEQARVLITGSHRLGPSLAQRWMGTAGAAMTRFTTVGVIAGVVLGTITQLSTQGAWTVAPIAQLGTVATCGLLCGAVVTAVRVLAVVQVVPSHGGAPRPARETRAPRLALLLVCLVLGLLGTGVLDRFLRWQAAWVSRWGTTGLDGLPEGLRQAALGTGTVALACLLVWCLVVAPLREGWRDRGHLRFWTDARMSTGILRTTRLLSWPAVALLFAFFSVAGAAAALGVPGLSTAGGRTFLLLAPAPLVVLVVGLLSAGAARFVEHRRDRRALAAMGLRREQITPPWAVVSGYAAGWLVVGVGSLLVFVVRVDGVVDDRTYPALCAVVLVPVCAAVLAALVHSRTNSRRISDENVRLHRLAELGAQAPSAGVSSDAPPSSV